MIKIKRSLANYSFYDNTAIEKKLEQMASNGWMIRKTGNLFWTYEKIEPCKLKFTVTYFPGASEFDPYPSEKQLDKEDLCAQDGWRLVLRWDAMQIFCTDKEDAVPIETDPVPYVENIHMTMRKNIILGQLASIALIIWSLYLQISQLCRDPANYLSGTSSIFSIPAWILLLILSVLEVIHYFRWEHKARQAAESGVFLPIGSNKILPWAVVILVSVFLLISYFGSEGRLLLIFSIALALVIPIIAGRWIMKKLKQKGVSRRVNIALSCLSIAVLVIAGFTAVLALGLSGQLPIAENKMPVGTYEQNGYVFDIYDDPLPLEVEELVETDAEWSKEAHLQETFLVSYGEYRQDIIGSKSNDDYSISYEIIDIKKPFLYEFIKNKTVNSRQDEISGDTVFIDHFEPVDPSSWNAEEVYQLVQSDQ